MDWFKKYREAVVDHYAEKPETEKKKEHDNNMTEKSAEEWIWIDGYKATDKDMKCRGYQFEMNKCFDISDDKPVELCGHGFHLCVKFNKVLKYYRIGDGNRFFEVKALVRKRDYDNLGPCYFEDPYDFKTRINVDATICPQNMASNFKPANSSKPLTIENVIFNNPATIVFWSDGTKTVVKADGEPYDPEKGIAMAIVKKTMGDNKYEYYHIFLHWLKKWNKQQKDTH